VICAEFNSTNFTEEFSEMNSLIPTEEDVTRMPEIGRKKQAYFMYIIAFAHIQNK